MKYKKKYILSMGMLLIQFYAPLVVYGAEVRSAETEGAIGFTGVYETPGTPVPAPEAEVKPDLPKEISQQPSGTEHGISRRLPKTNEEQKSIWTIFGLLLIIATLGFWLWKKEKNEESRN
ncbi:hypothetical protein IGK16_002930 [Enterococcus pernyi]